MAFFQNSVLNKHLKAQDEEVINAAYERFAAYFHDPVRQQNIRDSKEEQFQEGFLRELFVKILGYTLNPEPDYNLTTELKNEKGAKKADGAILIDGKALGVIELKGTDTKDLDKINAQAFNYKNNQTGCVYVITSNFEKLRFFIHDSVTHEEFNLFTLTKERFQLLWLCLAAENLLSGLPLKVKEESLLEEDKITKQLYKDYAAFRNDLWQNMVKNNTESDKLLLFKKTQKLLDRYLFIFFAEDSGLLPPNSISRIVKRWEILKQEDTYRPLYDIFKQYFGYINTGRKGQKTVDDIFAYNGGLFLTDELLDNIVLDDDILYPHVTKLTKYDFQSEVDVNILGHIFENSLNEIESIAAELEGQEIDKSKTKRKKDGVFYTPKYITKYIVDNTVGKLCTEKKAELGVIDEEYAKGRRNRKKDTIKKLDEKLKTYRNWLLNISICDPACGSGAFLNQALEFLMQEHAYIDELHAQLFGSSIVFQDVSNHILEKNIFGVDINEESVDIAKLSLWLRTAQRGRKLTTLNNNIKCGNSLIDDPSVAGEKALNWQKEFPTIFDPSTGSGGGFDVVIGNPPYVQISNNQDFYSKFYLTAKCGDLYALFYEKSHAILKNRGKFSFITPSLFIKGLRYESLRNFLLVNFKIIEILDKGDGVFQDVQMPTAIFVGRKENIIGQEWSKYIPGGEITSIIEANSKTISEFSDIKRGLEIGKDKVFHYRNDLIKILTGEDVDRYSIKQYKGITKDTFEVYKKDQKYFEGKRIVIRETGNRITSLIVNENVQQNRSLYAILLKDSTLYEYFLGIINSKLMQFYYKSKFAANTDIFPKIRIAQVKELPIKIAEKVTRELLSKNVTYLIDFKDNLIQNEKLFMRLLQSKFEIEKLTTKLQNWHELEFKDFLKELKKAKVQLSLSEEAEWMKYFNEEKQKAQELKSEINRVDGEIDQIVYKLYELTDEEIKIVEGN